MLRTTAIIVFILLNLAFYISGCSSEHEVMPETIPEAGGTVTGSGIYSEGEEVILIAKPKEGYEFKKWTVEGEKVTTDNKYSFVLEKQSNPVAVFALRDYELKLDVEPKAGGTVVGGGIYEHGEEVEVVAPDKDKYRFVKWLEGDEVVSEDNTYRFTIEKDRELKAVRELDLDLDNMLKKDMLSGYLLPVINNSRGSIKLINVTGETVVKESEYIQKVGKYGFVDRNGKLIIDPVYDWVTSPVNQVMMALKDGALTFIDLEGQHVVEPIEVDPDRARPHNINGINMSYFEGPQVYNIFGRGYFNRNGWIKKPQMSIPD